MTSHLASISAKVSVHVHFAMHFGANIDIQEKTGWTPLMIASKNGHAGIASLLVQHGANLDLQETTGFGFELEFETESCGLLYIDHMEKNTTCGSDISAAALCIPAEWVLASNPVPSHETPGRLVHTVHTFP